MEPIFGEIVGSVWNTPSKPGIQDGDLRIQLADKPADSGQVGDLVCQQPIRFGLRGMGLLAGQWLVLSRPELAPHTAWDHWGIRRKPMKRHPGAQPGSAACPQP